MPQQLAPGNHDLYFSGVVVPNALLSWGSTVCLHASVTISCAVKSTSSSTSSWLSWGRGEKHLERCVSFGTTRSNTAMEYEKSLSDGMAQ